VYSLDEDPLDNLWISMENQSSIHGLFMDYPWIIHGLSMDNPWIIIDNPWILYGGPMDYPWIIDGLSMNKMTSDESPNGTPWKLRSC